MDYTSYYSDRLTWIWISLEWDGRDDLSPNIIENEPPEDHWLAEELQASGWSFIAPGPKWTDLACGWITNTQWATWGLEKGIAPTQPFKLTFLQPRYLKHFDGETTEYDTEFDWSLDEIVPLSLKRVERLWSLYTKRYERYHQEAEQALCAFKTKRETDKLAMYLHFDGYYTRGFMDEMAGPDGCLVDLCSVWTESGFGGKVSIHPLLTAHNDHNNRTMALVELKARAISELHFTPEEFDALPHEVWGARQRQKEFLKRVP